MFSEDDDTNVRNFYKVSLKIINNIKIKCERQNIIYHKNIYFRTQSTKNGANQCCEKYRHHQNY